MPASADAPTERHLGRESLPSGLISAPRAIPPATVGGSDRGGARSLPDSVRCRPLRRRVAPGARGWLPAPRASRLLIGIEPGSQMPCARSRGAGSRPDRTAPDPPIDRTGRPEPRAAPAIEALPGHAAYRRSPADRCPSASEPRPDTRAPRRRHRLPHRSPPACRVGPRRRRVRPARRSRSLRRQYGPDADAKAPSSFARGGSRHRRASPGLRRVVCRPCDGAACSFEENDATRLRRA